MTNWNLHGESESVLRQKILVKGSTVRSKWHFTLLFMWSILSTSLKTSWTRWASGTDRNPADYTTYSESGHVVHSFIHSFVSLCLCGCWCSRSGQGCVQTTKTSSLWRTLQQVKVISSIGEISRSRSKCRCRRDKDFCCFLTVWDEVT